MKAVVREELRMLRQEPDVLVGRVLKSVAHWGPTGSYTVAFHDLLYDGRMPPTMMFLYLAGVAIVAFTLGMWTFGRLSPRFAEEM